MQEFVVIARFPSDHEAYLAKSYLNSKGIFSRVVNENTGQAFVILTDQMGGIGLEVEKNDAEQARELLIENGIIEVEDTQENPFVAWVGQHTDHWPLLGKIPAIFRILAFVLVIALISLIVLALNAKTPYSQDHSLSSNTMPYWYLYKIDAMLDSDPALALSTIQKMEKEYPQSTDLWMSKGVAYFNLDSLTESYNTFVKVKELFTDDVDQNVLYNLGLVKMEQKEYDRALEHFAEGSTIDSSFFYDMGQVYELKGEINKAIQNYSTILQTFVENKTITGNPEDYKFVKNKIDSLRSLRNEQ